MGEERKRVGKRQLNCHHYLWWSSQRLLRAWQLKIWRPNVKCYGLNSQSVGLWVPDMIQNCTDLSRNMYIRILVKDQLRPVFDQSLCFSDVGDCGQSNFDHSLTVTEVRSISGQFPSSVRSGQQFQDLTFEH